MKLGPWEIALILTIITMVFGAGKLPDIGKQIGKGIRDFKKYSRGTEDESKTSAGNNYTGLETTGAKLATAELREKTLEQAVEEPA